jgi:hypothetical protein
MTKPRTAKWNTPERKARAIVMRSQSYRVKEILAECAIGKTAYFKLRKEMGVEVWKDNLAELKRMAAKGATDAELNARAGEFLLGAKTERAIAGDESPLSWRQFETTTRQLFKGKAEQSEGDAKARYEGFASAAFWDDLRAKHPGLDDTAPEAVLPTALHLLRGIKLF